LENLFPYVGILAYPTYKDHFSTVCNLSLELLTGQLDPTTPALETPAYVTNYKLFVCPGTRKGDAPDHAFPGALYRTPSALNRTCTAGKNPCSYMYAVGTTEGLNLQTHPETVIMADAPNGDYGGGGYGWRINARDDNHGRDGINVLYVDGRVKWVSTTNAYVSGTGFARTVLLSRKQYPFSPYGANNLEVSTDAIRLKILSPKYW